MKPEGEYGPYLGEKTCEQAGVGSWSRASAQALNIKQENQTNMAKKERISIITPEARLSFPTLFAARKVDQNNANEKAKFSVQLIFRTAETAESKARGEKVVDLTPLKQAVAKLFLENLGPTWAEKLKLRKSDGRALYNSPFRDGAAEDNKEADGTYKAGLGIGTVFIRASSLYKPGVINADKSEILNPQDIYGGCYGHAQVNPYWYKHPVGGEGVTFGLENVQKARDGEPFSGRQKAEDVFEAIEPPAGAVPAGAGAQTGDPLAAL